MAETSIEWAEHSWNVTTGCDRVSPGCAHCYAATLAKRLKAMGHPAYQRDGGRASGPGFGLTLHPERLTIPLRRRRPTRYFVDSMSDLFHEDVPDAFIDEVFAVMAAAHWHTFQILTKRPERMREYLTAVKADGSDTGAMGNAGAWFRVDCLAAVHEAKIYDQPIEWRSEGTPVDWPLPNVWLGVTTENQRWADHRIPILLDTPAAVRFLSVEPMLGPVDIDGLFSLWRGTPVRCVGMLDWVIVGGESGPRHRPFDPAWARSILAQCQAAGVAVFVKQLGGARPGSSLEALPEDLRVREFPA